MPRDRMSRSTALNRARDKLRGRQEATESSPSDKSVPAAANVTSLEQKREELNRGRLITGSDEAGKCYLRIRFHTTNKIDPFLPIDCSDWLRFDWLAHPLATAYFHAYNNKGAGTITVRKSDLDMFLTYLDQYQLEHPGAPLSCLGGLNRSVFNGYITWLDGQFTVEGTPLHPTTKANVYSGLNVVIKQMQAEQAYKEQLPAGLALKKNPWPQRKQHIQHASALSLDGLKKIYLACIKEMVEHVKRFDEAQEELAKHLEDVRGKPKEERNYRDHGVRLAALVADYGIPLPERGVVKAADPRLIVQIEKRGQGGLTGTMTCLYPTARVLVPFIVMFAIHSSYNAEPLLALTRNQVRQSAWFKEHLHVSLADMEETAPQDGSMMVSAQKNRARDPQVKTWPINVKSIDNPAVVLLNVLRMTGPIRKLELLEMPGFIDRVFLFVTGASSGKRIDGKPVVRGFFDTRSRTASGDALWQLALSKFRESHDLPEFTLQQIRATGSDILSELTGDDVKAQQAWQGHASPDVTDGSYTGPGARERNAERLALYMDMRYRFVEAGGKRDLRGAGQHSTHRAVTPGFECFSPRESPIPGQRRGKMCSAYLECIGCPLAAVNTASARDLAYLLKLEKAMIEIQPKVAVERWVHYYAPKLEKLRNKWLPKFDPDSKAWDEARKIIDQLPDFILE